jgi:hypothetical protein
MPYYVAGVTIIVGKTDITNPSIDLVESMRYDQCDVAG